MESVFCLVRNIMCTALPCSPSCAGVIFLCLTHACHVGRKLMITLQKSRNRVTIQHCIWVQRGLTLLPQYFCRQLLRWVELQVLFHHFITLSVLMLDLVLYFTVMLVAGVSTSFYNTPQWLGYLHIAQCVMLFYFCFWMLSILCQFQKQKW